MEPHINRAEIGQIAGKATGQHYIGAHRITQTAHQIVPIDACAARNLSIQSAMEAVSEEEFGIAAKRDQISQSSIKEMMSC